MNEHPKCPTCGEEFTAIFRPGRDETEWWPHCDCDRSDEWTPAPPEVRAVARERIAQIRQSLTKEQSA